MWKKMIRFLQILALLFAVSIKADPLPNPDGKLKEAKDGLKDLSPSDQAQKCDTCGNAAPTMTACASLICNAEPEDTHYLKMIRDLSIAGLATVSRHQNRLEPKIKKWVALSIENELEELRQLKAVMKLKKWNFDKRATKIHNFLFFSAYGDRIKYREARRHPLGYEVDPEETRKALSDLSVKDQDWFIQAAQGYLWHPSTIETAKIRNNDNFPVTNILKAKFKSNTLHEALQKMAEEMRRAEQGMKADLQKVLSLPDLFFGDSFFSSREADPILKGERNDFKSIEDFYLDYIDQQFMRDVFLSNYKVSWLENRDPGDSKGYFDSKAILENIEKKEALLEDKKEMAKLSDDLAIKCASQLSGLTAAFPSPDQLNKGKKRLEELGTGIVDFLKNHLSDKTVGEIQKTLGAREYYFPKDRVTYERIFNAKIDAFVRNQKERRKEVEVLKKNKSKETFFTLNAYDYLVPERDFKNELMEEFDYCDEQTLPLPNDASGVENMEAEGITWISWYVLNGGPRGESVMAHELGHVAQGVVDSTRTSKESKAKLSKIKECLVKKHPDLIGNPVNEDFADLIAAKVVPNANSGCFLWLHEDESGDKLVLEKNDLSDPHSSALFRILHSEHVRKGTLPQTCQDALAAKKSTIDFSSCFAN